MVMKTIIVDRMVEELTRRQLSDIRDMLQAGFPVLRIAQFFQISATDLQRRLDTSIRQRSLFEIEVSQ